MIKSTLANLPIYFMSIFKCLVSVVNCIKKLEALAWKGQQEKVPLVDWNSICGPKNGGLGFRPLKNMNLALLGKWLWRIGENVVSLWKDIILASMGWDGMGGTFWPLLLIFKCVERIIVHQGCFYASYRSLGQFREQHIFLA